MVRAWLSRQPQLEPALSGAPSHLLPCLLPVTNRHFPVSRGVTWTQLLPPDSTSPVLSGYSCAVSDLRDLSWPVASYGRCPIRSLHPLKVRALPARVLPLSRNLVLQRLPLYNLDASFAPSFLPHPGKPGFMESLSVGFCACGQLFPHYSESSI